MTTWNDVKDDPKFVQLMDHGFVGLIDVMGDDAAIDTAARCSYGTGTRKTSDMRGLIRYLVRHYHTSPLEMVELKFHIKIPIFVMRQHVRHRTANLNEYSARYSEMTDEYYVPEISRFQGQHSDNKQASGDVLPFDVALHLQDEFKLVYRKMDDLYHDALDAGLARELARIVLPVGGYTELYWKIDLKNFLHYVRLRDDPHAQKEIQILANAMYELVKPHVPLTCEAFEDFWQQSVTFSKQEMVLLKGLLSKDLWHQKQYDNRDDKGLASNYGMSVKELGEFVKKLDI